MSHLCRLPLEGVTAKWLNFSPLLRTIHCIISNRFALTLGNQDVNIFYGRQRATSIVFEAPLQCIAPICLYSWTSTSEATNLIPGPLHWGNIPWLHSVKTFCQTVAVAFGIPLNPTFNICKFLQNAPQGQMLLQYR